jgi:Arc/MetJ-type ribon-helix-helix transcriptional regulator
MNDQDPKAKSKSVSLLPTVWEKIDGIIQRGEFENRSDYIRALVMEDFLRRAGGGARRSASPDAMAPAVMVDLTRELLGRLDAETISHQLENLDQRHVLRDLLRSFISSQPLALQVAEKPGTVLHDAKALQARNLVKTPPPKAG